MKCELLSRSPRDSGEFRLGVVAFDLREPRSRASGEKGQSLPGWIEGDKHGRLLTHLDLGLFPRHGNLLLLASAHRPGCRPEKRTQGY